MISGKRRSISINRPLVVADNKADVEGRYTQFGVRSVSADGGHSGHGIAVNAFRKW
jgi:hypothetical protein